MLVTVLIHTTHSLIIYVKKWSLSSRFHAKVNDTLGEAAYFGFPCLGFGGCRASLISCSIKWNSSSELTSIIYMLLAFNSLHQLNFSFTKLLNIYYLPTRFYPRQNILWNALVELIDIIDVFAHSCQQRLYCIGADKPNGNRHFV